MTEAKTEIDSIFGEGYAAKNPVLVAAFMQAAASDMNTAALAKVFGHVLQELSDSIRFVGHSLMDK